MISEIKETDNQDTCFRDQFTNKSPNSDSSRDSQHSSKQLKQNSDNFGFEVKNFSHFSSKCICYCCSKVSYFKSSNRMELSETSLPSIPDIRKKYRYEFKYKKMIKFRSFKLFLLNFSSN